MGAAIGDILGLAAGVAVSPLPIVAMILMLATPTGRANGTLFGVGWLAGLAVLGAVVLALAGPADASDGGEPAAWTGWLKLLLGVLALLLAAKQWRGRPGQQQHHRAEDAQAGQPADPEQAAVDPAPRGGQDQDHGHDRQGTDRDPGGQAEDVTDGRAHDQPLPVVEEPTMPVAGVSRRHPRRVNHPVGVTCTHPRRRHHARERGGAGRGGARAA